MADVNPHRNGAEDQEAQQGVEQQNQTERWRYRIDREHPIGGEMSDVLGGLIQRLRLKWLLRRHARLPVLALSTGSRGLTIRSGIRAPIRRATWCGCANKRGS